MSYTYDSLLASRRGKNRVKKDHCSMKHESENKNDYKDLDFHVEKLRFSSKDVKPKILTLTGTLKLYFQSTYLLPPQPCVEIISAKKASGGSSFSTSVIL